MLEEVCFLLLLAFTKSPTERKRIETSYLQDNKIIYAPHSQLLVKLKHNINCLQLLFKDFLHDKINVKTS